MENDNVSSTSGLIVNLGQKAGDKFLKLSKAGFSMECFTAEVLKFFTKNV